MSSKSAAPLRMLIREEAHVSGPVQAGLELTWSWISRTLQARYQQTLLGWLWTVVSPATQAAIFTVLFTLFIPLDVGDVPYVLFAYVSIVPWTFTQTALMDMAESIVQNMSLVTKIYFPREILPISAMLARLVDFAVASSLTVFLMAGRPVALNHLALLPAVLLIHLALILGIGLACAAANVFYRDIKQLLQLTLQVGFYAAPIVYPLDRVPEAYRTLYSLNPFVGIIEGYRGAWLGAPMDWEALGVSAGIAVISLAGGWLFFKKREKWFADIV